MGPELVLLSGAWCRGRELTRPRMRNLLALLAEDPTPVGYRLGLGEDDIDVAVVLRHAAASATLARAGGHAEAALGHAEAGLAR